MTQPALIEMVDRLYGPIKITVDDLRLFQTAEVTRMRRVSLSAVPPWIVPAGLCANKFEHCVAVGHLARIVGERVEFVDTARDLFFAAIGHDLGTPPFSHLSEHFLRRLFGVDHEQFAREVIDGSEFAAEVTRQGGSVERVVNLITGVEPVWGDLMNGPIDLDNLDNSQRYGLSMGIIREKMYDPESLARCFMMYNGHLALSGKATADLLGWNRCRALVYRFVYSKENLAPGMMIFRALDLAWMDDLLTMPYFRLTDDQAYAFLLENCSRGSRILAERALRWQFYPQIFSYRSSQPTENVKAVADDLFSRTRLADEIAKILSVPLEDVCIYIGRDKGFKQIHLPIVQRDGGVLEPPEAVLKPTWHIQVFLHPEHVSERAIAAVDEYLAAELGLNEQVTSM